MMIIIIMTMTITTLTVLWNIRTFATDKGDTNSKTRKKLKFYPVSMFTSLVPGEIAFYCCIITISMIEITIYMAAGT
jgi:hypothetical protein